MIGSIVSLIFVTALAAASLFQGSVLAVDVYCYNDGTTEFCSTAVLDYEVCGMYSDAATCAANCGY
ncbi:MAG: hypothetical protein ACJ763_03915 [Bdellovibrionia bacterium]